MMCLPNAGSAAISAGNVFDYFDELRKIIGLAKQDVLFIDPYLDAAFVPRYLPHVAEGVTIRLLAREKLDSLLPAVDLFAHQAEKRRFVQPGIFITATYFWIALPAISPGNHSRGRGEISANYDYADHRCFPAVSKTYEDLWTGARVER